MTLAELGADIFSAPSLVSKPVVSYDWESHSGGIAVTKYRDGVEADSIFLQGDDALFLIDGLNRANEKYTEQDVLSDYFPSGGN